MSVSYRGPQLVEEQKRAFGQKLRELREARGLSLADVAYEALVTKAAIQQYEAGASVPSLGALFGIANALKIKPSVLVAVFDPPKKLSKKSDSPA